MGKYEKEQRRLAEKHAAAAGRTQHMPNAGKIDMGLVRSGVQDYVRHMGTPTMHIIDMAERGGLDHGRLTRDFHVPATALDLLPVYRAQAPAVRKDFSLDIDKVTRQRMVGAFADFTGVQVSKGPVAG